MRGYIFSAFVLIALACTCHSLEPIVISQDRGMAVLAGFSDVPENQSDQNTTHLNLTNQNESRSNQTSAGLWNWGKIPIGYELNENGTLTRLADDRWTPSI